MSGKFTCKLLFVLSKNYHTIKPCNVAVVSFAVFAPEIILAPLLL